MKILLTIALLQVVLSQDVFGDNPWPIPSNIPLPSRASFTVQVAHLLSSPYTPLYQWESGTSTITYAWDKTLDCYAEQFSFNSKVTRHYVYCKGQTSLYEHGACQYTQHTVIDWYSSLVQRYYDAIVTVNVENERVVDPFDIESGQTYAEWHSKDGKKWLWLVAQEKDNNQVRYMQEQVKDGDIRVYRFTEGIKEASENNMYFKFTNMRCFGSEL